MLIALISLLIALGLRKVGVNIPYFDNVIYAAKMKIAEMKSTKLQKTLSKTLTSFDRPIYNENKMTKPIRSLHNLPKTFSGKLKI